MKNGIEYNKDAGKIQSKENDDTTDEEDRALNFDYGSLCTVGKLWVVALRAILLGAKMCFIPSVKAAPPAKVPEKPKPMKYKDLPLYESPHYEYKDHKADKQNCPNMDQKIAHTMLLPHVSMYRKEVQKSLCVAKSELVDTCKELKTDYRTAEKRILNYMRDPKNDTLRKACMALGVVSGFYMGSGGGIPRKCFGTAMGTCAAGSICYPKETDEGFRTFMYYVGKGLVAFYNSYCGKKFAFRERVACTRDLPKIPPPTKPLPDCPKKK